ncbi:MAG: prepilin-type N-terminal cleavage/methylation domain-containing protein [Paludisphaera borealis]|uniref:prepilin-type N-terminal cleavage/methylation domain-containing protein n=1 Tax=Paludisphaera borealis TaxID=1387353 RepID=UPI00283BF3E4|nr:prepilin-type N-terminal cleavage/methylation domain-containing protein [Paludisphaera borealis]MDR3620334.1 prepilin-type N-terminal cleavage/methylation domain-containing protein [Paludisphaera borealis]
MRPAATTRSRPSTGGRHGRTGFTLIELLVVMLIILLVSAVALPVIIPALSHREVSEAARILQGALVGARDAAVHANAPRGIRLLPDPNFVTFVTDSTLPNYGQLDPARILAANRIVAIEPAPDYTEGRVNVRPTSEVASVPLSLPYPGEGGGLWPFLGDGTPTVPVLLVEEAITDHDGDYVNNASPNPRNNPTSWFWNVRVGDKIQIGKAGRFYTVVGPMSIGPAGGNAELFVNIGLPGQVTSPLLYYQQPNTITHEFLFLVNGYDDNGNGAIDEGWDGLDNNLDGYVDNIAASTPPPYSEWETEHWLGSLAGANGATEYWNLPYTISRRPTPSANARETSLPASVVVDLTTWADASPERSRLPVNRFTGAIDIMVSPQGEVLPNSIFSAPSSFSLADSYFHFWLAERTDLYAPSDFKITGSASANADGTPQLPPFLPVPSGFNPNSTMYLKGENRLLTLFTRNGQIAVNEISDFDTNTSDYNTANSGVPNYNPSFPLIKAQQGVRGGQ